jgi:hypothetical protein
MTVFDRKVDVPSPASPAHPTTELAATTEDQIRFRVRRLVATFRLNQHDREDLTQEARLRLRAAMEGHDPRRASRAHFAKVVLDFWFADRARRLRRDRMRAAARMLTEADLAVETPNSIDLREDVMLFRAFVAATAPSLSPVLDLLGTRYVRDIARALNIDPATVHRRIRRLQSIGRSWAALTGRPPGWHLGRSKF